jgi:hypothetical protein
MKTCKPVSRILAVVLAFACIAAAADNPTPNKHKFCTFECPGAGKGSGQGTGALGINLAGTIVGSCLGGNKLRSLSRVPLASGVWWKPLPSRPILPFLGAGFQSYFSPHDRPQGFLQVQVQQEGARLWPIKGDSDEN